MYICLKYILINMLLFINDLQNLLAKKSYIIYGIFCLISFVFLISWINSVLFFCVSYKLN